jgi:large subunit ribosomal protein L29
MMPVKVLELRELDEKEIRQRLTEAEEELANLKFQLASHQLDNTAKVKIARRDVAKLRTVVHEMELGIWKPRSEATAKAKEA